MAEAVNHYGLEDGDTFYTGTKKAFKAVDFLPQGNDLAQTLFETMVDAACDDVPSELCEDWLYKVPREEQDKLADQVRAVVQQWADEFGHNPTFYGVRDIVEHTVGDDEGK